MAGSKRVQASARGLLKCDIEQAWTALSQHEAMASWGPGMKVTVDNAKAAAPGEVGAVRTIAAPGPAPAIVEEITAFEAPSLLGYKGLAGVPFKDYRGEVRLTPRADGVAVEWTLSAAPRVAPVEKVLLGVVSRTLLALYSRAAQR